MQTPEERKASNNVASKKYREGWTEERRLAYNAYMREYLKTPEQMEKTRKRTNARNAKLREADPVGFRKKKADETRKRRWANPVAVKNEQIKHLFGITLEDYDKRLAERQGVCSLCKKPFDDSMLGRAVLDHCHETGKIREFVHSRCNLGISNFLHDPALCRLAADYLERHGGDDVI